MVAKDSVSCVGSNSFEWNALTILKLEKSNPSDNILQEDLMNKIKRSLNHIGQKCYMINVRFNF